MMQISQFEALLARVNKPARYTDGEWNAVHKDWAAARVRLALLYPDVYEVGMSHLGLHILYHVVNSHPDYLAERCYAPWTDMEAELRRAGAPLTSLESRRPLSEFDVVGVTLPYELTYTNVLNMLDLAGIPPRAADRTEEHPLVIGGGPGAVNPEPMADFFDALLVGEGEEALLEILEAARAPRREALDRLAAIPGVYLPDRYQYSPAGPGPVGAVTPREGAQYPLVRRYVADLDAAPFPTKQLVPYLDTVHSRVTLEIMRGCARGCRFCQAGACYRPRRERNLDTLLRQAEEAVAATGFDEVSLLAFTSVDYSRIEQLVTGLTERLGGRGVGVALPSLRADAFSVAIANQIQKVRKSGLTFAPEAGTERLREVIRKRLSEEDLFAAADAAFSSGWFRLKLYFMIGLPTETNEDVEAISDLVHRLLDFGRGALGPRRGRLQISVSVAGFVPKPHTPFQWVGQDETETLAEKQRILQQTLRARAVKLSWTDPAVSALEAAVSRGDRRLGAVIHRAWELGAKFDSWGEHFQPALWEQAFAECGLRLSDYAHQELPRDADLAWDHIACGPAKDALRAELDRALGGGEA